jgi:hypothetical protein
MHRVYNSAFMNMLRDEDNAKYRAVMKNTLEFDPEILKRFVNFMNNPDEESAVAQFGKGDKYFGVSAMLSTLPGLPMFGHGQIEGYAEKYGMEYQRAYWDEQPDGYLLERHEREIFPLLHRRYLFADVEQFLLYDFFGTEGTVNEDVFAYSNRFHDQRALVIYHNRFATARGWIRSSVAYSVKANDDGDRVLVQRTLGEGLGLRPDEDTYYVFRDSLTNLEYIREGRELWERGLHVELDAYKCHVFLDWREVRDDQRYRYRQLAAYLNGRGVPSVAEALQELFLRPVHEPFRELVNAATFRQLMAARVSEADGQADPDLLADIEARMLRLLRAIESFAADNAETTAPDDVDAAVAASVEATPSEEAVAREICHKLEATLHLPIIAHRYPLPRSRKYKAAVVVLDAHLDDDAAAWATLFSWLFVHALGAVVEASVPETQSLSWMDEWLLGKLVAAALQDPSGLSDSERSLGLDEATAQRMVGLIKVLIAHHRWFETEAASGQRAHRILLSWLRDREVHRFIQVNRYEGILWFNKESFEQLLSWMLTVAVVEISADSDLSEDEVSREIAASYDLVRRFQQAADASEYQIAGLLESVQA